MAYVCRRYETRKNIDPHTFVVSFGQLVNNRVYRGVKSFHMCSFVARSGNVNDMWQFLCGMLLNVLLQDTLDIINLWFAQTRRRDAYQKRVVLFDNCINGKLEVIFPAKNSSRFRKAGRGNIYWFLKMAYNVSAHVGRTPLRTVQQRNGPLYPLENKACPERRAHFARITGGSKWFPLFCFHIIYRCHLVRLFCCHNPSFVIGYPFPKMILLCSQYSLKSIS